MASFPSVPISNIFNTADYNQIIDGSLSLTEADARYLKLTGGNVNYLTSPLITGTGRIEVQNSNNTPITSSSNCNDYGLHLHSVLASSNGVYGGSAISFNNSSAENVPLAAIYLNKISNGNGELVLSSRNGSTCVERVKISDSGINIINGGSLLINGSVLNVSAITGVVAGTATANKALITDSNNAISFAAGTASSNYIQLGSNKLYHNNSNNSLFIDSSTAAGGVIIQNSFFNYTSSMLKLQNPESFWGNQELLFDLVKNSSINYRIYTANTSSLIISSQSDSGSSSGCLFFPKNSTNIGISNTNPQRTLHVGGDILATRGCFGSNANDNTNKTLAVLDGTAGSSQVEMRFGNTLSTNNCMTLTWKPSSSGSANNYIAFDAFGTNNQLSIGCDSRVAIGSAPGSAGLLVNSSVSQTIDAGGGGVSYFLRNGGLIQTIGPITSIAVAIRAGASILTTSGGFYTSSDRRIKKDIVKMDPDIDILKVDPVMYRYKNQDSNTPLQAGYIAQDLIRNGLSHVIQFNESKGLEIEDDDLDLKDIAYSVDYSKVCVLLHIALARLKNRVDELEKKNKID
jgi:hypothetical protein